jgi:hypothetical protein
MHCQILHEQQQMILMRSNCKKLTRSACEYTVFAPAQLLRTWRKQQPGWSWLECHGGGWESPSHGVGSASDFIFVLSYAIVVGSRFNGTLCTRKIVYQLSIFIVVCSFISITKTNGFGPSLVTEWLALLICIREVLGSNIGPETGCPKFFRDFLSLPRKMSE